MTPEAESQMHMISSFDNRTLLSCQILLAIVFGIIFFGLRRSQQNLRGIGSVACGFFLGIPGAYLLTSRGAISSFSSIVIANFFILLTLIFLYRGILRFLGSSRTLGPIWIASFITMATVFYFSQVHDNIVPRLIAISFTIALVRLLIAKELFAHAAGRGTMRAFAFSMSGFALLCFVWGIISLVHGASEDYMQRGLVLTFILGLSILSTCFTGLFLLLLCHERVLAAVRTESELDPLSGALNRRGIEHRLNNELKRAERSGQTLSTALIDIDYFKTINDSAGHAAGDTALREVATAISATLRAYDYLGRYGGDEFLLILPQTSCVDALVVTERIGEAVRSFFSADKGPSLTISIGLSTAIPAEAPSSLLARADQALYEAKHAGRNCTRVVLDQADTVTEISSQQLIDILLPSAEADLIQH